MPDMHVHVHVWNSRHFLNEGHTLYMYLLCMYVRCGKERYSQFILFLAVLPDCTEDNRSREGPSGREGTEFAQCHEGERQSHTAALSFPESAAGSTGTGVELT